MKKALLYCAAAFFWLLHPLFAFCLGCFMICLFFLPASLLMMFMPNTTAMLIPNLILVFPAALTGFYLAKIAGDIIGGVWMRIAERLPFHME